MSIYLIRSTFTDPEDGHLWWSNEGGFSDLGNAEVFTAEERTTLSLPLEGEWVEFKEVE